MDHNKNDNTNKFRKRSLRVHCDDRKSIFKELLEVNIHNINLQVLVTEMYKVFAGQASNIMNGYYRTIRCGTKAAKYL